MAPPASRNTILRLINAAQHSSCPCHSCSPAANHGHGNILSQMRKYATPVNTLQKEYAFEVSIFMIRCLKVFIKIKSVKLAASNLRFGDGVTAEVGMDLKNMKARKVCSIEITNMFVTVKYPAGWRIYRSQRCQAYTYENCEYSLNIAFRLLNSLL